MRWKSGATYTGDWLNNKIHGYGIMNYADGYTYEGEWENHKRNGKGKLIDKNGKIKK